MFTVREYAARTVLSTQNRLYIFVVPQDFRFISHPSPENKS